MELVVEADGGSRGNPGPAGHGAVVKDPATGVVLAEVADGCGIATNNVAEYKGLRDGLRAAYRLDPNATVHVRMDSKLVVEQMSGRWAIKHPSMRELAIEIRNLIGGRPVTWEWIPRALNSHADRLANQAMDAQAKNATARIEKFHENPEPADIIGEAGIISGKPANRIVGWSSDEFSPCTLILVRHGVTEMSLDRKFSGRGGAEAPLADLGRAQATAAAEELLARGGADVLYTSRLLRARQTGEIIAARLGLEPQLLDDVDEAAFGDWDGMTFADVKQKWPDDLDAWLASPEVPPPGGESMAQVRGRVGTALHAVLAKHMGQRVIVVSHVTPIKTWVQEVLGADLQSAFRMELAPCSITTTNAFPDGVLSLFGFAESSHLRAVPMVPGT